MDEIARTHEVVTVTRNGVPIVVMLAVDDYESLIETLDVLNNPPFVDAIKKLLREEDEAYERGEYLTTEQIKADLAEHRRSSGVA